MGVGRVWAVVLALSHPTDGTEAPPVLPSALYRPLSSIEASVRDLVSTRCASRALLVEHPLGFRPDDAGAVPAPHPSRPTSESGQKAAPARLLEVRVSLPSRLPRSLQRRLLASGALHSGEHSSADSSSVEGGAPKDERDGESSVPLRTTLLFGEHARELISAEVGLTLLERLCDAAVKGARRSTSQLAHNDPITPPSATVQLFPMVNPSGRALLEGDAGPGSWCVRENARGVDLNRNFPSHWEVHEDDGETGSGPSPLSEPETQVLASAIQDFEPHVFVSVHSGALASFSPYAFAEPGPSRARMGKPLAASAALADALAAASGCVDCERGEASQAVGYSSSGTSLDWAFVAVPSVCAAVGLEVFSFEKSLLRRLETDASPVVSSADSAVVFHNGAVVLAAAGGRPSGDAVSLAASLPSSALLSSPRRDSTTAEAMEALEDIIAGADEAKVVAAAERAVRAWGASSAEASRRASDDAAILLPGAVGVGAAGKSRECFEFFNPADEGAFRRTVDSWSGALAALCEGSLGVPMQRLSLHRSESKPRSESEPGLDSVASTAAVLTSLPLSQGSGSGTAEAEAAALPPLQSRVHPAESVRKRDPTRSLMSREPRRSKESPVSEAAREGILVVGVLVLAAALFEGLKRSRKGAETHLSLRSAHASGAARAQPDTVRFAQRAPLFRRQSEDASASDASESE